MGPTAVEREHVLPAGEMKMFLSPCLRHPPQPALPQPPSRNGIDGTRHWDENYFTVSGAIKTKLICHIPRNCTPFLCFNIPLHVCSVVEEAFFVFFVAYGVPLGEMLILTTGLPPPLKWACQVCYFSKCWSPAAQMGMACILIFTHWCWPGAIRNITFAR